MVVIELRFPAGRYHATPWGRNVNEGIPEWPPSPFRLARALLDVWRRRRPDWEVARILPLLRLLAKAPSFRLPHGLFAHTRSYLSQNQTDPTRRQKIFDAFVAVEKNAAVLMGFPGDLLQTELADLNELLQELPYLGRSESWIDARVADKQEDYEWNCQLRDTNSVALDQYVLCQVACLSEEEDYLRLQYRPRIRDLSKQGRKRIERELTWLESIELSSGQLLADGWSLPPSMVSREYLLPRRLLERKLTRPERRPTSFRWARFNLESTVRPTVLETVSIAERVRKKLMGIHREIQGGDPASVSWKFSGKTLDGLPAQGHGHAFFLPIDEDGDGRLDHFYISVKEPFTRSELRALERCRSIWQSNGKPDLNLILSGLSIEPPIRETECWVSVTPFLTARHYRKGRGTFEEWLKNEFRREVKNHGLPEVVRLEIVHMTPGSHPRRWLEFQRQRKGQTPRPGYGFKVEFAQPVPGPFALGSGCHFGLGIFLPVGKETFREPQANM